MYTLLISVLLLVTLEALEIADSTQGSDGIAVVNSQHSMYKHPYGILQHAPNTGYLYFKVEGVALTCKPYGIVSLHQVLYDESARKECREAVLKYFKKHPKDYYFSDYHLYLQQKYHLEFKQNSCVIHSNGSISYARELLDAGLAMVEKKFKDKLLRQKYRESEEGARFLKKGMYNSSIPLKCSADFRGD